MWTFLGAKIWNKTRRHFKPLFQPVPLGVEVGVPVWWGPSWTNLNMSGGGVPVWSGPSWTSSNMSGGRAGWIPWGGGGLGRDKWTHRQTDTHNWKHYLSATSLAGGNQFEVRYQVHCEALVSCVSWLDYHDRLSSSLLIEDGLPTELMMMHFKKIPPVEALCRCSTRDESEYDGVKTQERFHPKSLRFKTIACSSCLNENSISCTNTCTFTPN